MGKPEPDFHFKLRGLFSPRKNISKEVGIKPGFDFIERILGAKHGIFMEYASKMEEYA